MSVRVKDVVKLMEELAPPYMAEQDDPIGLQVGDPKREVNRICVALDVTEEVVDECIREGAEMIVAHHPIIYRPLKALRADRPEGRLMEKLVKNDISVYAAHTNLDTAEGGVNDMMARAIGITECRPLLSSYSERLYKLVVFVPSTHAEAVSEAMFAAGAGQIGNYSRCSFTVQGTGTFMPEAGTNPYIGEQGKLERVAETRVETIVPDNKRQQAVDAMLRAHPYEEVAYDLYAVELKGKAFGLGRIGKLADEMTLEEFAGNVKHAFAVPALRVVGNLDRKVRKIAVLGGSGRSFLRHALSAGADVFVTGDIDHHTAHDALAAGLAIVDPGHHAEQIMKRGVADYLNERLAAAADNHGARAYASTISTEPFLFL
jgi:dinuclear metal center YbgI/SA1388 family protein